MDSKARKLIIQLESAARIDLDDIWRWNASRYGSAHASKYRDFVLSCINGLADSVNLGKPVPGRPEYRSLLIQRRSGGHGHLAVYGVIGDKITVIRIFHTSQDWPNQIT